MASSFTRQELYDLVWSQPMRTVAGSLGISDVALAKHCKKANIPVPPRGYWARKQASKPTFQIALQPRFPGASHTIEIGSDRQTYDFWGCDWPQKILQAPVPPVPTFDEEISSVADRIRKMVARVRCPRNFDRPHPLIAKLLTHDEERRQQYLKWGSSYHAPKYDGGIERRRLLILNALFTSAAGLGCQPSMGTSKYAQDSTERRGISIKAGITHVSFTIEPIELKKAGQKERLSLAFGTPHSRTNSQKIWEDDDERTLEDKLTEIVNEILLSAEVSCRDSLIRHREWVMERKAEAELEIQRRKEEAERRARELREKQARERIARLLSQASALNRANQIRAYVQGVLVRSAEIISGDQQGLENWAVWAREEADRIDPILNGTIVGAISDLANASLSSVP